MDYRISWDKNNAYVDILCPCRGTKKGIQDYNVSTLAKNNMNIGGYTCRHSAFWRDKYYSFSSAGLKKRGAAWRIKAGHCMRTVNDKLPDEK